MLARCGGIWLVPKPLSGVNNGELRQAMLYSLRNPAVCGLKVDSVATRGTSDSMQRPMRLFGKLGRPQ